MTTAMTDTKIALIDGQRHPLRGPSPKQLAFLKSLGLGPSAFLDPHCSCVPIIPAKEESKG